MAVVTVTRNLHRTYDVAISRSAVFGFSDAIRNAIGQLTTSEEMIGKTRSLNFVDKIPTDLTITPI